MTYIKPDEVNSPKANWSLISVLHDGGQGDMAYAVGTWNGVPALGLRWNGNAENPLGNPQSRGKPTWTLVEPALYAPILARIPDENLRVLGAQILRVTSPVTIELKVSTHPSGRRTLVERAAGQHMFRDTAAFAEDGPEFYEEVLRVVLGHLSRGAIVRFYEGDLWSSAA